MYKNSVADMVMATIVFVSITIVAGFVTFAILATIHNI